MTVSEEDGSLNAPVVVDEVRIIKVHTPPFALRRETAQEKYLGIRWQEWYQWMIFHSIPATCYILFVQIGCHLIIGSSVSVLTVTYQSPVTDMDIDAIIRPDTVDSLQFRSHPCPASQAPCLQYS